jgi:Protein of unknown function (DUF541)
MSTSSGFLGFGLALGLAAGLLGGVALAGPAHVAATGPSPTPTATPPSVSVGAPWALPAVGVSGPGVAQSGTGIAYPYFGGTPGLAPDHTIVVTGVGEANMTSDGSDRTAAEKTAIAAALADAKTQADAIARATGLTISGVLSVSASVSPSGPVPLPASGSTGVICSPPALPAPSGKVIPQPGCPPVYRSTLDAAVTVEYRVA